MTYRILAFTVAIAATACGAPVTDGGLQDDRGRTVPERVAAQRIVSLSPATTELLFALGVGGRIVGRSRFDLDPAAAEAIPSVGDGLQPNVEIIMAQRPDLVVAYHAAANAPAIGRLEDAGIPVIALRLDGLDDLVRGARLLGQILGATGRVDSLVGKLEAGIAAAAAPAGEHGRAVVVVWTQPPVVIGRASFLHEIVELAGWTNAFADVEQASASVGIEVIAAREPDAVIVGAESAEAIRRRDEWQVVDAVRGNRIVVVTGSAFSHPSFRAPAAIATLRGQWGDGSP